MASLPGLKRKISLTQFEEKASGIRSVSTLESLPIELLQIIFFSSLNGALLRASPRIAWKLSGPHAIKRCAYFLAFSPHLIQRVQEYFELKHMLPQRLKMVEPWDRRSMTNAILCSKWCTVTWLKVLESDLVHVTMMKLFNDGDFECDFSIKELTSEFERMYGTPYNDWVACPRIPDLYEFKNGQQQTPIWTPGPFSLRMFDFSISLEREYRSLWGNHFLPLGFRERSHINLSEDMVRNSETHLRSRFSRRLHSKNGWFGDRSGIIDETTSLMNNNIPYHRSLPVSQLSEMLYSFSPEDTEFKIPYQSFVLAARQIEISFCLFARDFEPPSMLSLFAAAPYSLPQNDGAIHEWKDRAERVLALQQRYVRAYRREGRRSHKLAENHMASDCWKYLWRVRKGENLVRRYQEIINYIETGDLAHQHSRISPSFENLESPYGSPWDSRDYWRQERSKCEFEICHRDDCNDSEQSDELDFDSDGLEDLDSNSTEHQFDDLDESDSDGSDNSYGSEREDSIEDSGASSQSLSEDESLPHDLPEVSAADREAPRGNAT